MSGSAGRGNSKSFFMVRDDGNMVRDDGNMVISADGQIVWSSGESDAIRKWHTDPETTRAQRFLLRVLAPFAPEELL